VLGDLCIGSRLLEKEGRGSYLFSLIIQYSQTFFVKKKLLRLQTLFSGDGVIIAESE
jgi:hypothetical protein